MSQRPPPLSDPATPFEAVQAIADTGARRSFGSRRVVLAMGAVCGALALIAGVTFAALPPKPVPIEPAMPGDRYGDWLYECRDLDSGEQRCSLVQRLLSSSGEQMVALLRLRPMPGNPEVLEFIGVLPLGLDLPVGVSGQVDGGPGFDMPLRICLADGCVVRGALTDESLEVLTEGSALDMTFKVVSQPENRTLKISLAGLDEALAASGF